MLIYRSTLVSSTLLVQYIRLTYSSTLPALYLKFPNHGWSHFCLQGTKYYHLSVHNRVLYSPLLKFWVKHQQLPCQVLLCFNPSVDYKAFPSLQVRPIRRDNKSENVLKSWSCFGSFRRHDHLWWFFYSSSIEDATLGLFYFQGCFFFIFLLLLIDNLSV